MECYGCTLEMKLFSTKMALVRSQDGSRTLSLEVSAAEPLNYPPALTKPLVGGENIYPLEIEERLVAHEAIDRAIVVGIKHSRFGEVVGAFLQRAQNATGRYAHLSDEGVRDWVRMKLGRHKAPAYVFWLGEDGIPATVPLTGSGKVRKFELARLAEQLVSKDRAKL